MANLTGVDIASCLSYLGLSGKTRMTDTYANMANFWEDSTIPCPTEAELETAWTTVNKQQKLLELATQFSEDSAILKDKLSSAWLYDGTAQATKVSAAQTEFTTLKSTYATNRTAILAE